MKQRIAALLHARSALSRERQALMSDALSWRRLLEIDAGAEHDRVVQVEIARIARTEHQLAIEHVPDFEVAANHATAFQTPGRR